MRIVISGICGFAGSTLARALVQNGHEVAGLDNFIRPGSESNREPLKALGIRILHGDVRSPGDFGHLPRCDWFIDAAANPSVLAGVDGRTSSRQIVEHNLAGTVNMLEFCKAAGAGFILLSTSRVYSIDALRAIPLESKDGAYRPRRRTGGRRDQALGPGGVTEAFPTTAPISLYGATKLASEALALEYGQAFGLPVYVNRCGVLAGAGQFGRADQGIFAFWINSYLQRRPLKYLGFGGRGLQTRDCLHPRDLVALLEKQFRAPATPAADRVVNVSGGMASAMSLRQLSDWCASALGPHQVGAEPETRAFDVPWLVLDHAKATRIWKWKPRTSTPEILEEIAAHARANPDWLDLSAPL